MTEKMVVAYVCDARYIKFLNISMESVKHYNKNVEFAVLTADKNFSIPGVHMHYINPDASKFKFNAKDRMHEGVYYKLWLPELPYDKILYIDCDVMCQRPLDSLWNMPCDFICATESHIFGKKQAAELGVERYALSGMMLMNLKKLREIGFTAKCLDMLSRINPHWHDETIINTLFNDKITFIDHKYNYCRNRVYENPIPESDAYLLHYVGGKQKEDMLRYPNYLGLAYLRKFIKGKTVAIVGNASSILTKNQGQEIDAHDVVIRFNRGLPNEKVGFRTSILFLACTLTQREIEAYGMPYMVKRGNGCKNPCHFRVFPKDKAFLTQSATNAVISRGHKVCQASTGFIAIDFALSSECKSIDLYGFDFFKTPTYYNPANYATLHNGDEEGAKILEYEKSGLLKIH